MNNSGKTHFRKVFKSDHLGQADLEEFIENGSNLIFTINRVEQRYGERVAGKKIDCNIAFFNENIKPLVLNATNSKIVRSFNGNSPFVEDWGNTLIELYIDKNVKMKGQTVGGVRIKTRQPQVSKEVMCENHPHWENGKARVKRENWSIEKVREMYKITEEDYKKLCE